MNEEQTTYVPSEQYQVSYEESTLQEERRLRCIEAAVSLINYHHATFIDLSAEELSNRVLSAADDYYLFVENG